LLRWSDLAIGVPDEISVIGFNGLGEIGVGHLLNITHRRGADSTRYVLKPILAQKEYGFYFENRSRIFAR